jgi:hypothetical protein
MNSFNAMLIHFFRLFGLSGLLWLLLALCDHVGHPTNLQHHFLNLPVHLNSLILLTEWALFFFFLLIIRLKDKDLVVDAFPVRLGRVHYALIDHCS